MVRVRVRVGVGYRARVRVRITVRVTVGVRFGVRIGAVGTYQLSGETPTSFSSKSARMSAPNAKAVGRRSEAKTLLVLCS